MSAPLQHADQNQPRRVCHHSATQKLASVGQLTFYGARWWRGLHTFAVGLFSVVDLFASFTLYFELAVALKWVVPYLFLSLALMPYMILACAAKTTIVAGWQRRQWLHGFPWVRCALAAPVYSFRSGIRRGRTAERKLLVCSSCGLSYPS